MADLPLFPTKKDEINLKDFVNVQSQLYDVIKKQLSVYEDIGHINKDVANRIEGRLVEEEKILKNTEYQLRLQQRYSIMSKSTDKVKREYAEGMLKSIEKEINYNNKRVEQLRTMSEFEAKRAKREFEEKNAWGNLASKIGAEQFGIKNKEYTLTKSIGEELSKYPYKVKKYAGVLAVAFTYIVGAYNLFLKFDKTAAAFRMKMGMTREEVKGIRKEVENVAIQYAHVGVTIDGAYKAVEALSGQMGSMHSISSDLIKNVSVMASQLGVSEANATGFMRVMASVSKSTMQSQQDTMYMAANMSRMAGVPLNEVMSDIAKASSRTLTMMSRWPNTVLRTAIEARRMGTTIGDMAKSSRSILDFSESVNAEMDASVLLGRSINLQRARELAYRRDLEGSTKEILRITKQIDFENLDVFQQEAFAKATGRSVEELMKMVQAERQWEKARRDPNLKGKIEGYEKLRKSNEATARASAKNYENELLNRSNQERIVAIQQKWNQLMMQLQKHLLPVIDGILSIIPPAIEFGNLLTRAALNLYVVYKYVDKIAVQLFKWSKNASILKTPLLWVSKVMSSMAYGLDRIVGVFKGIGRFFGPITNFFKGIGTFMHSFKWLVTIFKSLGKFTLVLNIVFAVWNVIKSIYNGIAKIAEGFGTIFGGGGIMKGLLQIGHGIIKLFVGPVMGALEGFFGFIVDIPILILKGIGALGVGWAKAAADWAEKMWEGLKDWFGFSPSAIGLLIVKGITSIGPMLFDAITDPFRKGLAWIVDKIPGMGKIAEKLRGGIGDMTETKSVEKRATAAYVPAVTVTPEGTKINVPGAQPQTKASETSDFKFLSEETGQKMVSLLEKILAKDVNINMDGQLLSATLARQSEFRGGYGVNKV